MSSVANAPTTLSRADTLPRVTAILIVLAGLSFFLAYLVYLPFPSLFSSVAAGMGGQTGILLYCLATAGAGFVAWGLMLSGMNSTGLSRAHVLKASAIGLGLLGFMRLGTALFPHAPFEQLRALPAGECVMFLLVALKLYKS